MDVFRRYVAAGHQGPDSSDNDIHIIFQRVSLFVRNYTLIHKCAGKVKKGGAYHKIINLKRAQEIDVGIHGKYFRPLSAEVRGTALAAAYDKLLAGEKVQFLFHGLAADL